MNIGLVIKKYRKELGLTQEEMANRLGVTTPAVNKWENGNSNPDIELLAPIARLLNISLDTLMSFHETLTDDEISKIIKKMDDMFEEEGFDKTFGWALALIKEYPNCNNLIWQVAVVLDARRMTGDCANPEDYDDQINAWYELALTDENEEIRYRAADSLFGFYLRKNNYPAAEKYLSYFSELDPMKNVNKGRLLKEQGKMDEALETLESLMLSEYSTLNFTISLMIGIALEQNDVNYAEYLTNKAKELAHTFEMGKYHEYSPKLDIMCAKKDIEGTFDIICNLLDSINTICDFRNSKLYKHRHFRNIDESYYDEIKEQLIKGCGSDGEYDYMKGYKPWDTLIKNHQ